MAPAFLYLFIVKVMPSVLSSHLVIAGQLRSLGMLSHHPCGELVTDAVMHSCTA